MALVGGSLTGLLLDAGWLFSPLHDSELFDDDLFFNLPEDDRDGTTSRRRRRASALDIIFKCIHI